MAVITVLYLGRIVEDAPAGDVHAGITAALVVGSVSPDVVAVEARKAPSGAASSFRQCQPSSAAARSSISRNGGSPGNR
jgi:hypothetical protein